MDDLKNKVWDEYLEHQYHQSFHKDCSTCYSENRMLRNWEIVNRRKVREELGTAIGRERRQIDDPRANENPFD